MNFDAFDEASKKQQQKTNGRANGAEAKKEPAKPPKIYSCEEVLAIETPTEEMLFDGYPVPAYGATLKVGAARAGKTILSVQEAVAVAGGKPLFAYYPVRAPGPVLIVERDDPGGAASINTILTKSGVAKGSNLPLSVVDRMDFGFGIAMIEWLEEQITTLSLRLVVLDSYTALRGSHPPGVDIVKVEQLELTALDELAKRRRCAIQIIHHGSKTAVSKSLDWTLSAAGSFVMAAATEAQAHVQRFPDLDNNSPERLVRIRGRHSADLQMVLKFREATLDFEYVLEGSAAALYPDIVQIKAEFQHQPFDHKQLMQVTGLGRSATFKRLNQLKQAGVLNKRGHGQFVLAI